jgi:hypothetical protein
MLRTASTPSSTSLTMNPVLPCSMTSGTAPLSKAITGVPQARDSIMTRPNGSGQSMGMSRALAPPRNRSSAPPPPRRCTRRADGPATARCFMVVCAVCIIHLCGDLQGHSRPHGDLDRIMDPFSGEILPGTPSTRPRLRGKRVEIRRQAVVHGPPPVQLWQRCPLAPRDGDHRQFVEFRAHVPELGQVEPPVQRRQDRHGGKPGFRVVEVIDMEMHDVVVGGIGKGLFDHDHAVGDPACVPALEPERPLAHGHEPRAGLRVAAGVEGHLVPHRVERFGQEGDDPLGPSVESWRDALDQGGDLSDAQPAIHQPFTGSVLFRCGGM